MQGKPPFGADVTPPLAVAFGGRNRMGERYDFVRTVRDGRYRHIRNYTPHRPWGQRIAYMWMAKGYQSWEAEHIAGQLDGVHEAFWHEKPAEEFYDALVDPDEVDNLIGASEHAERINEMRGLLDQHMLDINDNGFIPEGSPIEGYHQSRVPGAYPLYETMELAARAIQRSASNIAVFVDALDHDNEVIRYWGAQGLLILGQDSAQAVRTLRSALADTSQHVRVAVAEAYARVGDADAAVGVLADVLAGDAVVPAKVQALNALTFIGSAAAGATGQISAFTEAKNQNLRSASRYLLLQLRGEYEPGATAFDMGSMAEMAALIT